MDSIERVWRDDGTEHTCLRTGQCGVLFSDSSHVAPMVQRCRGPSPNPNMIKEVDVLIYAIMVRSKAARVRSSASRT